MNYFLQIRPEALFDVEDAAAWYDRQEPGLGSEFCGVFVETIDKLLANPLGCRLRNRRQNVRWILTKRFPYKVVYQIRQERIEVIAVIHTARREQHWKPRVKPDL